MALSPEEKQQLRVVFRHALEHLESCKHHQMTAISIAIGRSADYSWIRAEVDIIKAIRRNLGVED